MPSVAPHFCLVVLAASLAIGCSDSDADGADGSGTGGGAHSTGAHASGTESTGSDSTSSGTDAASTSGEGGGGPSSGAGGDSSSSAHGGGGAGEPSDPCPSFAASIVEVNYGPGAGFGQDTPEVVFGPPQGGGCCQGSLDVLSLGNGGSIVLAFNDTTIVDGDGPDLLVFENAFWAGGDPASPFAELGTVSVSADGQEWHEFPCTALEAPFGACAGFSPVYASQGENDLDPLDPASAGGEAFDLADVGLAEARFVRIVDRADQTGFGGTFDLDAVGIVNGRCDADTP